MTRPLLIAALLMGLGTAHAATEVLPASYTFDQETDCGLFCYPDNGGGELTDGRYGRAGWQVDLGGGPAAEWVGWNGDAVVNIDFTFSAPVAVDRIDVGTTQNRLDDVVLPSLEVFAWVGGGWQSVQTLATPEDAANNVDNSSTAAHGFLSLTGLGITADRIRVQARHSADGPWTFVDEVDFYAPVPEPGVAWLVGAALPLLWTVRPNRDKLTPAAPARSTTSPRHTPIPPRAC